MGYEGIEFQDRLVEHLDPADIKAALEESSLETPSMLYHEDTLLADIDAVIDFCKYIGIQRIVLPFFYDIATKESIAAIAERLRPVAKRLREAGIEFYCHNHCYEVYKIGDEHVMDLLLDAMEPEKLLLELDTFWVCAGGEEPLYFFDRYIDRAGALFHVKDGFHVTTDKEELQAHIPPDKKDGGMWNTMMIPCAAGRGEIDFPPVVHQALNAGIEWLIVENDFPWPDEFSDAAFSIETVKKW